MPETDPTEFTDREKFILSYFRCRRGSGMGSTWAYSLTIALTSFVCLILAVFREDVVLGLVAYAILVGRLYYLTVEGGRYGKDYQNIFAKYEAKLEALTVAAERKEGARD